MARDHTTINGTSSTPSHIAHSSKKLSGDELCVQVPRRRLGQRLIVWPYLLSPSLNIVRLPTRLRHAAVQLSALSLLLAACDHISERLWNEMRLINTFTLKLEVFIEPPAYAILSHRWEPGKVSFEQYVAHPLMGSVFTRRLRSIRKPIMCSAGYQKIAACCALAKTRGYSWLWIDTICIDKRSSTELSEAINSMWKWYESAAECYVYLSDVVSKPAGTEEKGFHKATQELLEQFQASLWFTRGWTLQELLAPWKITFCDCNWNTIYNHVKGPYVEVRLSRRDREFVAKIAAATGIAEEHLNRGRSALDASIAVKISWVAKRQTTRVEDTAYCLLGLLGINMPLLYGEGHKAFIRLQEELIRHSHDESIFAWRCPCSRSSEPLENLTGYVPEAPCKCIPGILLAPAPSFFASSGSIVDERLSPRPPYSITNLGLVLEAEAWVIRGTECNEWTDAHELYIIPLNCWRIDCLLPTRRRCALVLKRASGKRQRGPHDIYLRHNCHDVGGDIDALYPYYKREAIGTTRFYISY